MNTPLRWGILGAAKIARTDVAPAIHAARGAVLAALATTRADAAAPFEALAPGLRVHASYESLLKDPDVDAVYIPLPNHLHVDWTLRALAAGKHVLCEKPIALEAAQIDRLIAARDASGLMAAEAFMVTHHPQWAMVRSLLAEGIIGPLRHVEACFTYTNTDPANIRNRAETGGGGLRDVGVYPCVTTRFVTGAEPERLHAELRLEDGVDSFARVWAQFPGFTMSFHCSMRLSRRQHMVFHGPDGWIELSAPFNGRVYGDTVVDWTGADAVTHRRRFNGVDHYALMIEAFGAAARGQAAFNCPLEFSHGNQAMIDAILAAGRAGPDTP